MSLIFKTIQTEGIAELSYLVGDDSSGTAAVIDPTPDVEKYLELARKKNLSITHIFETHIHADLVSGARELADRLGTADIFLSGEEATDYGFDCVKTSEGDRFTFGDTRLTVRHTPGHTPEHVSYELASEDEPDMPWGVLTGDSLFVGSAGRPDLLGEDETEELTEKLFHTLRDYYLELPDGTIIFPAHGHGSPCGADIGDRLTSTIGYERETNAFLQYDKLEDFKEFVLSGTPPVPTYYPRMKEVNQEGPEVLGALPNVMALTPEDFSKALEEDVQLIDTRDMLAFGGGHIDGAMNIGSSPMMSIWAGWLLDPDKPILLVLESDGELETVVKRFLRTGYTEFAGYLAGGISSWIEAGKELSHAGETDVHALRKIVKDKASKAQIIDVRSPSEWDDGHIPGAQHFFLPELREKSGDLDKSLPVLTYCASGYRASIAASILLQEGFEDVNNVPGSWKAWKAAGFEIEEEDS
ncbi:MAG: MBL fold metallo-hydrolase [Luteolibacter sp.]